MAVGALALATAPASAAVVYSENFDGPNPIFSADAFYLDQVGALNGIVTDNTANTPFGATIAADASGTGKFLFEGTNAYFDPNVDQRFFVSQSFAVAANTTYTLSFKLTNANTLDVAQVQADFNGTVITPVVSAMGEYPSGQMWQAFNYQFNSGNALTGVLTFRNFAPNEAGDDFGFDEVSVYDNQAAVPEPGALGLAGLGLGLIALRRRRAA